MSVSLESISPFSPFPAASLSPAVIIDLGLIYRGSFARTDTRYPSFRVRRILFGSSKATIFATPSTSNHFDGRYADGMVFDDITEHGMTEEGFKHEVSLVHRVQQDGHKMVNEGNKRALRSS